MSARPFVCADYDGRLTIHSPLGFFSPGFKTLGDYADQMYASLDADRSNNGFLGMSACVGQGRCSSSRS